LVIVQTSRLLNATLALFAQGVWPVWAELDSDNQTKRVHSGADIRGSHEHRAQRPNKMALWERLWERYGNEHNVPTLSC